MEQREMRQIFFPFVSQTGRQVFLHISPQLEQTTLWLK
jgi:hypothetical protein